MEIENKDGKNYNEKYFLRDCNNFQLLIFYLSIKSFRIMIYMSKYDMDGL